MPRGKADPPSQFALLKGEGCQAASLYTGGDGPCAVNDVCLGVFDELPPYPNAVGRHGRLIGRGIAGNDIAFGVIQANIAWILNGRRGPVPVPIRTRGQWVA